MAERQCKCGHRMGQHELRSGGLLGCFISGCLCIDFEQEPDWAAVQPGLIPVGTWLPGFGRVVQVSLTAYLVEWTEACQYGHQRRSEWLAFQHVHGKPAAVSPLVVLR